MMDCKLVFKGNFYLRFVSFGIRCSSHIKCEIGRNLLSIDRMGCGFAVESHRGHKGSDLFEGLKYVGTLYGHTIKSLSANR
jgi:hypothetical protein